MQFPFRISLRFIVKQEARSMTQMMRSSRRTAQVMSCFDQSISSPQSYFLQINTFYMNWSLQSFTKFKNYIQYFDHKHPVFQTLSQLSSDRLVPASKILLLRSQLRLCQQGKMAFLQAGDCAQSFKECDQASVVKKLNWMNRWAQIIRQGTGKQVVKVGRIGGQFAKPRSKREQSAGLNSYFGDMVNSHDKTNRAINYQNLLKAFELSADVIKYLQKHQAPGSPLHTSHEGLVLPYQSALTRAEDEQFLCRSGSLLWIGERTRQLQGAHLQFFRGIGNPIGIKISNKITINQFKQIFDKLNPHNQSGRLLLIFRLGTAACRTQNSLTQVVEFVKQQQLNCLLVCDPMHGNGETTPNGIKTRRVQKIVQEIRFFLKTCRGMGNIGLHLQSTGENVTECLQGETEQAWLKGRYETLCDPRLNGEQTKKILKLWANEIN